jgi:hypothetical protein
VERIANFRRVRIRAYRGSKKGRFIVWRETSDKRMRAKLLRIKQSIQRLMHEPIAEGGKTSRKQRRYGSVREAISVGRPYRDNDYYYGRSKHDG